MQKKVKNLVMLILSMVVLVGNIVSVYAKESNVENMKSIKAFTEESTYGRDYEIMDNTVEIMPRFPVYKERTVDLTFPDWITPPSTYNFNAYDTELKTQMSGTLYLSTYAHQYRDFQPITYAIYKGTVAGNI